MLSARWRQEAQLARELGAGEAAQTLERCAAQLEAFERERALEALTLEQAASESGYSYSALQKLLATGRLGNVGEPHKPRVRRGDLPRKAGRPQHDGEPDLAALVSGRRAKVTP